MRGCSAPSAFNLANVIRASTLGFETTQLVSLSLCNLHPTGHSIKDGQFRLFNSGNSVIDGESGFPLEAIGMLFRLSYVQVMLLLSYAFLYRLQVVGNFRLERGPFLGGSISCRFHAVARGLYVALYFFGRRRSGSARLLPARHDFVMRFLLRGTDGILCVLCAD